MRRALRPVPLLLGLSLLLNLLILGGLVAIASSETAADRIAPVLGLAAADDVDELAAAQERTDARVGELDLEGTSLTDWLVDLDRTIGEIETTLGGDVGAELGNLRDRLADLEFQLDDALATSETSADQLDGFCSWVNSAVIDWIGTDLYFTYSDLRNRAC